MKIPRDAVSISCVLLTLSLVALVPHSLRYAATWQEGYLQETDRLWTQNYLMPIGFASLAFVLVGLIVIWTGYRRRVLWTWFVMFVVVWVFAFPVYMLPALLGLRTADSVNWADWCWGTLRGPGVARDAAKGPLDFVLMAFALFLPMKAFFGKKNRGRPVIK